MSCAALQVIPYILAYLPDATQVPQEWLAAFESQLPYARRMATQTPLQRRQSLCGLALARALTSASDPTRQTAAWRFDASGAVSIDGAPAFSISHARSLVGCVVASQGAVGFDVEHVDDVQPESLRMLAQLPNLSPSAAPAVQWTLREAALKHARLGLRELMQPQRLPLDLPWVNVPLPGGYTASIVGDDAQRAWQLRICDGMALLRQANFACGVRPDD